MITIPVLTDAPAPAESRRGVITRLGTATATTTTHDRAVIRRIMARQYGNATPAQALLAMAEASRASCSIPSAAVPYVPWCWAPEDRDAVFAHWASQGSTKEANAIIRILDGDWGTAGHDRWLARVAWLVQVSQTDIQAWVRTLGLDLRPERVVLPGHWGCRGWLARAELIPPVGKGRERPDADRPNPDDIFTFFG